MSPITPAALKEARRRRGLTQKDLAAYLKVTQVTVARWETGVHKIPESVVLAVKAHMPKKKGTKRTVKRSK